MVSLFGEKMGVDLFVYYPYLDCIDPIAVLETIQNFQISQRSSDFKQTKRIVEEASRLPDFKNKPWIYELEANRLAYLLFEDKKYDEVIVSAKELLDNIDPKYSNNINVANLYILISSYYQMTSDLVNAKKASLSAYNIVQPQFNVRKYEHIIVTVRLNLITLYYLEEKYEKAIEEGKAMIEYQIEYNSYARIHFSYIYLAFSYYKNRQYEEAFSFFNQCIILLMVYYRPMDVEIIVSQDIFWSMFQDERMKKQCIQEFKNIYQL